MPGTRRHVLDFKMSSESAYLAENTLLGLSSLVLLGLFLNLWLAESFVSEVGDLKLKIHRGGLVVSLLLIARAIDPRGVWGFLPTAARIVLGDLTTVVIVWCVSVWLRAWVGAIYAQQLKDMPRRVSSAVLIVPASLSLVFALATELAVFEFGRPEALAFWLGILALFAFACSIITFRAGAGVLKDLEESELLKTLTAKAEAERKKKAAHLRVRVSVAVTGSGFVGLVLTVLLFVVFFATEEDFRVFFFPSLSRFIPHVFLYIELLVCGLLVYLSWIPWNHFKFNVTTLTNVSWKRIAGRASVSYEPLSQQ